MAKTKKTLLQNRLEQKQAALSTTTIINSPIIIKNYYPIAPWPSDKLKDLQEVNPIVKVQSNTNNLLNENYLQEVKVTTTPNENHAISKQDKLTKRLSLDDALQQIQYQPDAVNANWSEARIRAFKMIDKNPNSYYYRFNAPGESQHKGKWTDQETSLFLNRLKEVGANAQWGIFSMAIPGRVGYQCSNYYRFLIESGKIVDPNYVVDTNGKARYLFDKKSNGEVVKEFRTHTKHKTPKKMKQKKRVEQDPTFDPRK